MITVEGQQRSQYSSSPRILSPETDISGVSVVVSGLPLPTLSFDLDTFIHHVLLYKGITTGSFEFTFIDNKEISEMNARHLGRSYATDILTFNLGTSEVIEGDVYISIEQAEKNASMWGNTLDDEIRLLVVHGILHLLDYRDYTEDEQRVMRSEEARVLKEVSDVI